MPWLLVVALFDEIKRRLARRRRASSIAAAPPARRDCDLPDGLV